MKIEYSIPQGSGVADIEIGIGEIAVAEDTENLTASGVGSCLVITFYESRLKIGAMAHAMLPSPVIHGHSSVVRKKAQRDAKYIDIAIDQVLNKLEARGAKRGNLEAKIVGGANMFSAFKSDISKQNVLTAKEKLKEEDIRLVGECVGGSQGRSVEFSVASGIVTVKTKF